MKRIVKFAAIVLGIIVFWGCDGLSGTSVSGEIILASSSKDVVTIDADGSRENVRFSSALDWHVEFSEDWLTVDPMEGEPGNGRIVISAGANETSEARQAIVKICSEGFELPITVNQEPFVATFDLLSTEKTMTAAGGEFEIEVYTDVAFEYHCDADWVHFPDTKAPRTRKVTVEVDPNTSAERSAVITFCSGMTCKAFSLTQRGVGTENDDWKHDEFVHRSLAMRFTATWCGYCPYMGTAFDSAKSQMSGELELLSLHGSQSKLHFSPTSTLVNKYKVEGYPTGIVDGRASIPNYNSTITTASTAVDVAKETKETYPVTSGIAISSSLDGTDLTVDISVYFKEADSYRVVALLLEDGIVGYQNGVGSNYTHNDVARLVFTTITGEAVDVTEDYTVWTKSYSKSIKSGWNTDNLKVLVYVEKPYGDQSRANGVKDAEYINFLDSYVDNCRAVPVGMSAELELK